jgi:uncharacterized protein YdaU (DUF1376 family)
VNFYKHHLGDYDSATSHLTWDEDMAYTRLMRVYYRDEKPLPVNLPKVCRLVRAQTRVQKAAVAMVLDEFFVKADDGWRNKRCDQEIEQAAQQAAVNRRIAEEREAKRARSANGSLNGPYTNGLTNRSPTPTESVNLSRLQTPDSTIQTPNPTPTPPKGGAARQRRSPQRAERDKALAVWSTVVATEGAVDDPKAQQAMRAIGGYSRIRLRTAREESEIQRQFIDAYVSAAA